jgi:hypothetical protein
MEQIMSMSFLSSEIKIPPQYQLPQPDITFSEAFGISPNGNYIVGTFGKKTSPGLLLAAEFHGFVTPPGASGILFRTYDHPKSRKPGGTSIRGVNDYGDVVGFYRDDSTRETHGFVWPHFQPSPVEFEESLGFRSANPDVPFPVSFISTDVDAVNLHNGVLGVNHQGTVSVGVYKDRLDNKDYGYIWGPAGPQIGDLPHGPVRVEFPSKTITSATNIRPRGVASENVFVGNYESSNQIHGFRWKLEWDSQWFDGKPDTIDVSDGVATMINGINRDLWIVGNYQTLATRRPDGRPRTDHGFVWKPTEPYTTGKYVPGEHVTVDIPGADDTIINGIATDGTFVGYYRAPYIVGDPNSVSRHAFIGRLLP